MSHVANKVGGEQQNVQNNAFIQQQQALNQNINSTKTVNKAAENDSKTGLIKEDGKADLPGKPKLYSVTNEFLDYLGLSSLDELPKLEEEKPVLIEETDLYESKYKENY